MPGVPAVVSSLALSVASALKSSRDAASYAAFVHGLRLRHVVDLRPMVRLSRCCTRTIACIFS